MEKLTQHKNSSSFMVKNWSNIFNPMAFSCVAYILYFIINYLGTQIFTTAVYGDLFLAWTWVIILGSCVMLGVDQSSRIFVSAFYYKKDTENIKKYIHWGLSFTRISLLASVIIAIICHILYDPLNIFKFSIFTYDHSQWHSFFAFIFIATPIVGITNWASSLLIAYSIYFPTVCCYRFHTNHHHGHMLCLSTIAYIWI